MNYDKVYSDILGLEPRIRMVTICNINGQIMFTDHRKGITNLLSPEESIESLELAANAWRIRSKLADKIGKGKYVLAEYEKIKRIILPFGPEHLLYITTEVNTDHTMILEGVHRLEKEHT